jgi:hypothetical protein
MTTPDPQAPAAPDPTGEPDASPEAPAQLREAKDRSDAKAKDYRTQLVEVHIGTIGLSPTEGLGIAIVDAYEGEPTAEAVAAFANEKYKYVHNPQTPEVVPGVPNRAEEHEAQTVSGQTIMDASQSVTPVDVIGQQAAEADAKFDLDPEKPVAERDIVSGIAAKMNAIP